MLPDKMPHLGPACNLLVYFVKGQPLNCAFAHEGHFMNGLKGEMLRNHHYVLFLVSYIPNDHSSLKVLKNLSKSF